MEYDRRYHHKINDTPMDNRLSTAAIADLNLAKKPHNLLWRHRLQQSSPSKNTTALPCTPHRQVGSLPPPDNLPLLDNRTFPLIQSTWNSELEVCN